jgi:peptidoglycan/LPS O-acetylase OafA/YrhL
LFEVPSFPVNPFGIEGEAATIERAGSVSIALIGLLALLAAASVVQRFRRASGVERQQLKWFAYAAAMPAAFLSMSLVSEPHGLLGDVLFFVFFALIPAAIGIAILRYRLYEIDRLINRTLVYGLLTALLAGVYAGAVLVLGQLFGGVSDQPPSWAVAGATLAVAALFQPARRRIQQVVDRRFNAASTTPP